MEWLVVVPSRFDCFAEQPWLRFGHTRIQGALSDCTRTRLRSTLLGINSWQSQGIRILFFNWLTIGARQCTELLTWTLVGRERLMALSSSD